MVVIAVAANEEKKPLFTLEERVELIRPNLPTDGSVELKQFSGLLVDFARANGISAMIRGLRAISDFEYEFQMAHMNRHLYPEMESFFLMPTERHFYTSSSLMKNVAQHGGDVTNLAPPNVVAALREKYFSAAGDA